ncbi:MAG TPA: serine/threonine-protein kinase, partial [Isosphaeraceae bacterium]|nr:serine/threonine-protein kinase [Isosphaeraceae bacterium]
AQTLERILESQQALSQEEATIVKRSVQQHLLAHQNDPAKSLAAVSVAEPLEALRRAIKDRDLQSAMAHVGTIAELSLGSKSETVATRIADASGPAASAHLAGQATLPTINRSASAASAEAEIESTQAGNEGSPTLPVPPPPPGSSAGTQQFAQGPEESLHTISFVPDDEATLDGPTHPPGAASKPSQSPGRVPPQELGTGMSVGSRYRIVRSHARGGLGEVYVAVDEELQREVALKEIQGRHADRVESQVRFLLEAEVTGGLEHPGVVPVYGLGRYPDGRPYYAMKFIRGECFKEAIDRLHNPENAKRDPGERDVELRLLINRFIDLCQTIAYAHSRGILHRDIKPDNVMLGAYGETLVVDWGLAKVLNKAEVAPAHVTPEPLTNLTNVGPLRPMSASGKSETMYGSAMGTPQYMSPEQAAGKLDELGPASDVYSLGATLYYVLTGVKAFRDFNLAELLRNVQRGIFERPREVNKSIHPALDAICLKAMANRPEDRYQTALDLVGDLEHYLADEPVSVYEEPLLERAGRWAKRHKRMVTSVAVALITGITALGVFSVLIKEEQKRTLANFVLARDAVDQMLTELGEVELADVPQMEPVRKKMLAKALAFYQQFLKDHGSDLTIRQETGRANIRLGDILEMLGDYQGSEAAYDRAVSLLEPLTAKSPAVAQYRRDLARARHDLGVLEKKSLRFQEAERNLTAAYRMRRHLAVENPGYAPDLRDSKDTVYQLGALLARLAGRQGEAAANYQEAVRAATKLSVEHPNDFDYQRRLARYRNNRGILLMGSDIVGAEEEFEAAFAIQDKLTKDSPTVAGLQWERARTLSNLGSVFNRHKQYEKALERFQQAFESFKRLSEQFPSIPDYQNELAAVYANLGADFQLLSQLDKAESSLNESVKIYEKLAENFPRRPDYPKRLSDAELSLSALLGGGKKSLAAAEKWCDRSQQTLMGLVASYDMVPEYQNALALTLEYMSQIRYNQKDLPKARKLIEQAIEHQRLAFQDSGRNRIYRQHLLQEYDILSGHLRDQRDHEGAVRVAGDVVQILRDDGVAHERAARFMALAAELVEQDTEIPAPEKDKRSKQYADRALEHLQQAYRYGFQNSELLKKPFYRKLRDREDFKAIEKQIESRAKPAVV